MTPCRAVDRRASRGFPAPFGPLVAGASRTFPLQSSTLCSIPAAAQADSLNITIVPAGPTGFLTAYPSGKPLPLAATLVWSQRRLDQQRSHRARRDKRLLRGEPHEWRAGTMRQATSRRKAAAQTNPEEILPEYDCSRSLPNKYAISTHRVTPPEARSWSWIHMWPPRFLPQEKPTRLGERWPELFKSASAGEHPGVIRKPASRFTARQASPPAARRRCSQSSAWSTVKPALFKAAMARSRCLSAMRM